MQILTVFFFLSLNCKCIFSLSLGIVFVVKSQMFKMPAERIFLGTVWRMLKGILFL